MNASKYYHIDELAIKQYLGYDRVLELAAKWLMRDGQQTLGELQEIKRVVREVQSTPAPIKLYRGITPNGFSNTHGITKSLAVGSVVNIVFDKATSFTSELKVATAFGKIVLETVEPINMDLFMWIPQELSLAVQRKFKFPIPNMHEWVMIKEGSYMKLKIIKKSSLLGSIDW